VLALSDFRIVLSPDVEFSDRELDWVEASQQWRLSDKERGSVTWEFDRNPTETALEALRDFFEIPKDYTLGALAKLSPGELVTMRSELTEPSGIRATRCEACGQHWIVYKLSGATWLKYGRKCENGWWLGDPVSDDEAMDTAGN
jgi:hypothetical protein